MLVAHRRPDTGAIQLLPVHCLSVAGLCSELCKIIGLEKLGYLTGLLHDMARVRISASGASLALPMSA